MLELAEVAPRRTGSLQPRSALLHRHNPGELMHIGLKGKLLLALGILAGGCLIAVGHEADTPAVIILGVFFGGLCALAYKRLA